MIKLLEGLKKKNVRGAYRNHFFLDNTGCYPVSLQEMFSNINVVLLPPKTK
jgi:hypothetical protein